MKSITAMRRHCEAGNILSNIAERRDRILFSIAMRRRHEAGNIQSNNAERRDRILFSIAVRHRREAGNILSNNAERRDRILSAADMSSIACWLHVLPQPRLAQNRRNHNGASAGEIGRARRKMVIRKVWPPKVDNRGRTAAAEARLIAAPHHPTTVARPKSEELQWGKRGGCWTYAARNSRAKSAAVRPKEYCRDGAQL
jgi:hypothetical protein